MAERHKLNIVSLGAYILKIQRSGTILNEYKEQFIQIRHGYYDDFLQSVRILFPDRKIEDAVKVKWYSGNIKTSDFSQKEGCDMEGLLNAETGVAAFGNHLYKIYGKATDPQFTTNVLECVIEYELGFRNALCNELMKRNINHNFIRELKIEFQDTIDIVCMFRGLTPDDKQCFHQGRKFINYVKHKNLNSFISVEDAVQKFGSAYQLSTQYGLTLT